ncbi:membrane-associated protein, putative, partial [Bodo saltans]
AACFAMQWGAGTLAALTTAVVCLFAYLRPVLTRIDTASYVALGVLAVASEVAAAAGDETTSNGFAVTALALQLTLTIINLIVETLWRASSIVETNVDGCTSQSVRAVTCPSKKSAAPDLPGKKDRVFASTSAVGPSALRKDSNDVSASVSVRNEMKRFLGDGRATNEDTNAALTEVSPHHSVTRTQLKQLEMLVELVVKERRRRAQSS